MAKRKKKSKISFWDGAIPVIVLLLAIAIVAIVLTQQSKESDELITASYQEALQAFRSQGVSEVIVQDLATDFSSGEYTLESLTEKYPGFEEDIRAVNEGVNQDKTDVIAVVNGEELTTIDLKTQKALLPPQISESLGDANIVEQMINELLIIQEARLHGLTASEEEIEAGYQELLERGAMTEEQLTENLASYGLTLEDLRGLLGKQATINKIVAERVETEEATEEEARAFYDENIDTFKTEGQVTVKHILITPVEGEEGVAAEDVLKQYEEGADFCELVSEYSADLGSKETCGEYTFGRGFMVPEFEEASFKLGNDDTEIVTTQFGQHIILKISSEEASVTSFEEVVESIVARINGERQIQAFEGYIQTLRDGAEIENSYNVPVLEEAEVVLDEPVEVETETVIEIPEEVEETEEVEDMEATDETEVEEPEETEIVEETEEVPEEIEETEDEPETEVEDEIETEVEEEVEDEPVEETEVPETEVVETATDFEGFVECLTQNDVILYTASWNSASLAELNKFGSDKDKLAHVDCTEYQSVCEDANVQAYPTWKIGDELFLGVMSYKDLSTFSGCELPDGV